MQYKPYYVVDKSIYFTDKTEEVIVHTFDQENIAGVISNLLNEAYNAAYQDGLSDSTNEQYKELIDQVKSLSIENLRLKRLKMNIKIEDLNN